MTEANGQGEGSTTAQNSEGSSESSFMTGLSEDNAALMKAKSWSDPNAVVDSYRSLEQQASLQVGIPTAESTPEQVSAFREKFGVPKEAAGYEFTPPEGLPENAQVNTELWDNFKEWAHEAGLSTTQAQDLYARGVQFGVQQSEVSETVAADMQNAATDALAATWGPQDGDLFKRNVELTDRAIRNLGGAELRTALEETGVLSAEGAVMNAAIVQALSKVGANLFAEDTLYGGITSDKNPFSKEHLNLSEQGRILKSNPQHAQTLIQLAGLDPKQFGLEAAA